MGSDLGVAGPLGRRQRRGPWAGVGVGTRGKEVPGRLEGGANAGSLRPQEVDLESTCFCETSGSPQGAAFRGGR